MTKIKVGDFVVMGHYPDAYAVEMLGTKQAGICALHAPDGIAQRHGWRASRVAAANLRQALRFDTAQEAWDYLQALEKRFALDDLYEATREANLRYNKARATLRDAFLLEVAEANKKVTE